MAHAMRSALGRAGSIRANELTMPRDALINELTTVTAIDSTN